MTFFTYTEKCSFFFYNLYPFHFFSGQGVKIVFKIKLFKKFIMKDTMRCPEDYEFLALKKLVFPFFFGGGGVKMLRCLSLLPPPLKNKSVRTLNIVGSFRTGSVWLCCHDQNTISLWAYSTSAHISGGNEI